MTRHILYSAPPEKKESAPYPPSSTDTIRGWIFFNSKVIQLKSSSVNFMGVPALWMGSSLWASNPAEITKYSGLNRRKASNSLRTRPRQNSEVRTSEVLMPSSSV